MRSFLSNVLIASALLATSAFAQQYDRPPYERFSPDRSLFNHVRADIDRAAAYPYASRADLKRFDEARRDVFDFESRLDSGRYEKKELTHAIDRIQDVLNHNSLAPQDRGALDDDLRRMRDFRAYRDNHVNRDYGYR